MEREILFGLVNKIKKNKLICCCLLAVGIGVTISFIALIRGGSLWFDEIFSVEIAKKSLIDSWQYLKYENNPPLYYWFLHFYIKIFGTNELILRLFSFLPALLSIFLFYVFAKNLFNKRTALIAMVILSLSPLFIRHSSEVRMYVHLFLWIIIASHFFWQLINNDNRKRNFILFFCSNLIVLFLHITGILFVASQLVFIIINHRTIKNKILIICILVVVVASFLPWVFLFLRNKLSLVETGGFFSGWYFNGERNLPIIIAAPIFLFSEYLNYYSSPYFLNLLLFVSGFTLILSVYLKVGSKKNLPLSLCLIFLVFPLMTLPLIVNGFMGKFYISSAIFYYLIIAHGINISLVSIKKLFYKNNKLDISFSLLSAIFIMAVFSFSLIESRYFGVIAIKGRWQEVTKIIEETRVDVLVGSIEIWPTKYYQKNDSFDMIYFFPDTVTPDEDIFLNVTRYNWVMFKANEQERENLQEQFKRKVSSQTTKIGCINGYLIPDYLLSSVLIDNKFVLEKTYFFESGEPVSLSIFKKQ